MNKPIITVENLSKAYRLGQQEEQYPTFRDALVGMAKAPLRRFRQLSGGGNDELFWAVNDVSFEINRGDVVGLIGRNGAGKSTLLKILSRITEPTSGRAVLRGRVASLLEVGTGFHPELSGRENIYLNGSILGMKKVEIDRKFDEIVAFAEVEQFLDTPVKRYSSGMYVRLAFAVAAHLEPEILIVDEVLAVGDAQFQKKCLGKMQEVSTGEGRTVLFVSHNMSAVTELCQRAMMFRDGQLVNSGPTANVVDEYLQCGSSDLKHYFEPNVDEDREASLLSAAVHDSSGDSVAVVRFGEPWSVTSSWEVRRPLPLASASLRVFDLSGRLILVSNTVGLPTAFFENPGTRDVTCSFPVNVLRPGQYFLTIGLWVRGRGAIDEHERCISFHVSDLPHDPEYTYTAAGNPAAVAPSDWSFRNNTEPALTGGV